MTNFKWFASFVLAATIVSTLGAETHCPGNVASVPFHLVNRHQIIVAVSINHSGPYNFLLDTGTQITMVDPVPGRRTPPEHIRYGRSRQRRISCIGFLCANLDLARSRLSCRQPTRRSWCTTSRICRRQASIFRASSERIFSSSSTC